MMSKQKTQYLSSNNVLLNILRCANITLLLYTLDNHRKANQHPDIVNDLDANEGLMFRKCCLAMIMLVIWVLVLRLFSFGAGNPEAD